MVSSPGGAALGFASRDPDLYDPSVVPSHANATTALLNSPVSTVGTIANSPTINGQPNPIGGGNIGGGLGTITRILPLPTQPVNPTADTFTQTTTSSSSSTGSRYPGGNGGDYVLQTPITQTPYTPTSGAGSSSGTPTSSSGSTSTGTSGSTSTTPTDPTTALLQLLAGGGGSGTSTDGLQNTTPSDAALAAVQPTEAPTSGTSNPALIVAVIAIIGLGAWYWWAHRKKKKAPIA